MGQSVARKFNIDSKCFSEKQNVSQDNAFLFETLHTTPTRHICLTQAAILSSTSNFLASAALSDNMRPQVKYTIIVYFFRLRHSV